METKARLHPLLTAAAISVTVFSAVGVAAVTGLIPSSIGSHKQEAAVESSQEVAQPVEPVAVEPVVAPTPQPSHQTAAKPVKKPLARTTAPKPATPVAYNDYG